MEPVAQDSELEEGNSSNQSCDNNREDNLHRDITLCTSNGCVALLAAQLVECKSYSLLDDARLLDDTNQTSHSDTADADRTTIHLEQLHRAHCRGLGRSVTYQRYDNKPYKARACGDDYGILQADDITQTEQCSACIERKLNLELVGDSCAPLGHLGRDILCPRTE